MLQISALPQSSCILTEQTRCLAAVGLGVGDGLIVWPSVETDELEEQAPQILVSILFIGLYCPLSRRLCVLERPLLPLSRSGDLDERPSDSIAGLLERPTKPFGLSGAWAALGVTEASRLTSSDMPAKLKLAASWAASVACLPRAGWGCGLGPSRSEAEGDLAGAT